MFTNVKQTTTESHVYCWGYQVIFEAYWGDRLSLTHCGRVTHICINKLTIIGSDNGLSPGRRQAIIWTNAEILISNLRNKLQWNSKRNPYIFIQENPFENGVCEMASIVSRPQCVRRLFNLGMSRDVHHRTVYTGSQQIDPNFADGICKRVLWKEQGKSEGFESCDWPIVRKRPIWVKIGDVSYRVTLKFDRWPWKTIGHLSFAVSSFVQHFIAIGDFKLELQSGNAHFGSNSTIFRAVWPWNLTDDLEKQ